MHKFIKFVILFVFSMNFAIADDACLEKRYAFDVGSGAIKSTGNLVDKCKGRIVEALGEHNVHLKFEQCMITENGVQNIDKKCLEKARAAITEIEKFYNIDCNSAKCAGVATEWARKAKNSNEVLEIFSEYGVKIKLLDQAQEGNLGFYTAETHDKGIATPDDKQVVFDVGGGSFQIAVSGKNEEISVLHGRYGVESFHKEIHAEQKLSKPYLSRKEISNLVDEYSAKFKQLIQKDNAISARLGQKELVVLGIGRPLSVAVRTQINLTDVVSSKQLMDKAVEMSNLSVDEVKKKYPLLPDHYVQHVQSSLVLILSIMKASGFDTIHILDSKASDYIATDNKFWL